MAFDFQPNTKFSAIHLCGCSGRSLPDTLQLSDGLSAHTSPVMELTDLDRRQIGDRYSDAFSQSTLVLVASMHSELPGILDHESERLHYRANMFFYGVLMQGVPNIASAVEAWGSRTGPGEPWANRLEILPQFYRHPDVRQPHVSVDALNHASAIAGGLHETFDSDDFMRLRSGVNALVAAWKTGAALPRLHAFVRALAGLMQLERGAGERQFVARTCLLASGARIDEVARELYWLRSHNEHLSDWPTKLGYVKKGDRKEFVSHRTFHAEALASEIYRSILSNAQVRGQFKDGRMDAFWQSSGPWPAKVDIDALDGRFRYVGDQP